MAKSEVFGNRDLTRRIVQAKHGVGLLRASMKIRSEEECAALFEKCQRVGCPTDPSGAMEQKCMREAGKVCEMSFTMTAMTGRVVEDFPAEDVTRSVLNSIQEGSVMTFKLGESTSIRIHCEGGDENGVTVVTDGWRKRGVACGPTRKEIDTLVSDILTRVGRVRLPCLERTSAGSRIEVPRQMSLTMQHPSLTVVRS